MFGYFGRIPLLNYLWGVTSAVWSPKICLEGMFFFGGGKWFLLLIKTDVTSVCTLFFFKDFCLNRDQSWMFGIVMIHFNALMIISASWGHLTQKWFAFNPKPAEKLLSELPHWMYRMNSSSPPKKNSGENPPLKSSPRKRLYKSRIVFDVFFRMYQVNERISTGSFPVAIGMPTKSHIHVFIHIFHKKHHGLNLWQRFHGVQIQEGKKTLKTKPRFVVFKHPYGLKHYPRLNEQSVKDFATKHSGMRNFVVMDFCWDS